MEAKKIKEQVVFCPALFMDSNKFYQKYTDLQDFAELLAPKFLIHQCQPGINLVNRSSTLVSQLTKFDKFHLIAHSRGGIDARFALFKAPELQKKCLSLTTIGTPHLGSPLADYFFLKPERLLHVLMKEMLDINPLYRDLVQELTFDAMEELNKKIGFPECPKFCLPFLVEKKWKLPALDRVAFAYMNKIGVALSDAVVPLPSQLFGTTIGDHQLGNIKVNYGSHKAEATPINYGLPWQKIWHKTFNKCFQNILKIEKENEVTSG